MSKIDQFQIVWQELLARRGFVVGIYSLMAFYLMQRSGPTPFMMLFSLLIEFIILISGNIFLSWKVATKDDFTNALYLAMFAVPISILHYFIGWQLLSGGDVMIEYEQFGALYPLDTHYAAILLALVSLSLSYYLDFKEVINKNSALTLSQYSVFKHILRLWTVGLFAMCLSEDLSNDSKVVLIASVRIVFELYSFLKGVKLQQG